MSVIIISGGIGSGKSTVTYLLEEMCGWPVYGADARVKEIYREYPSVLSDIEGALSDSFHNEDGLFLPSRLASRIFTDNHALNVVEQIVFPVLIEDFNRWKLKNNSSEHVIIESATILEKPELIYLADLIVVVDAPLETRVRRAVERDEVSKESVLLRVKNQPLMNSISNGDIPQCVDYIIRNDGSLEDLRQNVSECVEFIVKQKCYNH